MLMGLIGSRIVGGMSAFMAIHLNAPPKDSSCPYGFVFNGARKFTTERITISSRWL